MSPPSPSEQLAEKIIQRLIAEGLLDEQQGERLLSGLATGKLKPADWRIAIDLSQATPQATRGKRQDNLTHNSRQSEA